MTDSDDIKKKKVSRTQTSMLVWVLMAMLVTGLGGFGVTNFGLSTTAIGSVGNQEIQATTYARALRTEINRQSQKFGVELTLQQAQLLGLDRQVLAQLTADAALDNEAARIGLSVGDARLAAAVAADDGFYDVTGQFNADNYKRALDQAGLTVKSYEADLRATLARTILQSAVVGGVTVPAALTDTLLTYSGETRGFTVVEFSESTLPTPLATPTPDMLKTYYDAKLATFTRPEAKRITYAALLPADIAAQQPLDETKVQDLYNERLADYVVPEKRLVERVVYPTEAEAQAAKARLDAGESFETLVKDRGLDLTDIDLGDVTRSELGAAGDAVFALTGPGVAGPLASDLGPALYRMNAILAARETTLAEVHDIIAAEIQTEAAVAAISDQASAIDDALAGGATLEDIARDFTMTLATIDFVTGADDNDPITQDRAFATEADRLAAGDYPQALMLGDGGLAALRMDAVVPPTPLALDKITDRVAAGWHAAELAKTLTALATKAEAAVKAGGSLADQGPATVIAATTRDLAPEGTTPDVVQAAFAMVPDEVRLIDTPTFTGLIRLDSITPFDSASDAAKMARENLTRQVRQTIAQDSYGLLTSALTAEGGLVIDQAVIASVQSQMT